MYGIEYLIHNNMALVAIFRRDWIIAQYTGPAHSYRILWSTNARTSFEMILSSFVLCCIILTAKASLKSESTLREVVNFDFGWRFHFGDIGTSWQCSPDEFPQNRSGVACRGLTSDQSTTADTCRDSCCGDIMCAIWQFDPDKGCWLGSSDDCKHPSSHWVGGERKVPAKPPAPAKNGPTSRDYDDSSWDLVDVPHDALISGTYSQDAPEKHGYLPLNITWYRKHFNLPSEWKGRTVWVYFEGIFRASTVYLNGEELIHHDSGYTSFTARLDNSSSVFYGDGKQNENVVAIRADATHGTGWWYEGGGIYRHTHLISANLQHVIQNGLYGGIEITGEILLQEQLATEIKLHPTVEVANDDTSSKMVQARFNFFSEGGGSLTPVVTQPVSVDPGKIAMMNAQMMMQEAQLWSINHPYLYTLQCEVMVNNAVVDAVNVSIGVRRTVWDPDTGFYLNDAPFIWRGFNNHNDFTGVGVAVPDRVNLFRAQSMRAVGANSWRMSHNPPIPVMLDIMDRVGVIVWDENRNFGDNPIWVQNEADMVKRDRNHPSVMIWSFCNEGGCDLAQNEEEVAMEFKKVSNAMDQYRFVTANQNGHIGGGLSSVIDVQGFSHRPGSAFDDYHKQFPKKPLIGSECCSCRTQRGEDVGDSKKSTFSNFNADCNQAQTGNQLNRKFVAGCMVWTLFDYYGEPTPYGWPMVSSSFGSIDLAGFAKASAYWYRSWWLYSAMHNKSLSGEDVPSNPPQLVNPKATPSQENMTTGYIIHIVQSWEPISGLANHTIHVYTNAPMAELFVNGKSMGVQTIVWQGWAQWSVTFTPGKLMATATNENKEVLASHTVETAGGAAKVVAYVDVPSNETGTGSMLVLDGQDAGMVSAAIVDASGNVVPSATNNITFSIVSGPGRIIGVGNGNPSCHEPNKVPWRSAYHGLARVIVQVTMDASTHPLHRHRLRQIDRDGGILTHIVPPEVKYFADQPIVVEASVDGLGSAQVSIPVTADAGKHSVLSVASGKNK